MKKKYIILSAVFLAFLALGVWLNTQRGVFLSDVFWREEGADVYVAANGDRVRCADDEFIMTLNGREVTATKQDGGGSVNLEFSEGWTAVLRGEYEDKIRIDDIDKMGLSFSEAAAVTYEPFYDDNDVAIGESVMVETKSGESIYAGARWYDGKGSAGNEDYIYYGDKSYQIGESAVDLNPVTLKNGLEIDVYRDGWNLWDEEGNAVYINERSEYLLDTNNLFYISAGGTERQKTRFARFLIELPAARTYPRGEPGYILLYVVLYLFGAFTFLYPEKMAFWGSRWMYKDDPELSESGLALQTISGIIIMALGVIVMLVPAFVHGG